MVTHENQDTRPRRSAQGLAGPIAEANKITAATPFDFEGKNLTASGGLLPVATMLEKLNFPQVVEETLRVKRVTRSMTVYQFVLAMVWALSVGFSRLHHLRFLRREPMLVGISKVLRLPPQSALWRFLAFPASGNRGGPEGLGAGAGGGPPFLSSSSVHKVLCTCRPSKPTSYSDLTTRE
jgi:hypothetical protein